MTGMEQGGDTPMGPPWSVDVLADLYSGVLDTAVAERLWPQVRQDPAAVQVLNALYATQAELTSLGTRPAPAMPARYAARLDATMAAEVARTFGTPTTAPSIATPMAPPPMAPVLDLARARRRRNQRVGWIAGGLVAAAAVAVAVIGLPRGGTTGGVAGGASLALTSGHLGSATLAAAVGRSDYGPLTEPARRTACLAANQVDQPPVGALQVTLDGKPGVLMVLTTGKLAQYRLLVVGPDCAAGNPDRLADAVVGGLTPPTR
jgi:hypothetical protein